MRNYAPCSWFSRRRNVAGRRACGPPLKSDGHCSRTAIYFGSGPSPARMQRDRAPQRLHQKETIVSETAVLERPAIEDTLFGEPKVLEAEGEFTPDDACFCVCWCKKREDKIPNSENRLVDTAMA